MLTYLPIIGSGHTIVLVITVSRECVPPRAHAGLELPLLSKDNPILISKFESRSGQQSERLMMTSFRMKYY